ncbi:MAG TPA: BTAD domain-containing putative transcriptional regulator [Gaiellaceae bacterium]
MTAASASELAAVEPAQLVLMDGFSLRSGGAVRHLSASAQRLVALVALQGRSVPRQRAAFTLWPDASEAHAYGSLRTALFRLRAVCPDASVLECGSEFELSASVGVDARRAYELAARLESSGARNGDAKELELLLAGGELLPDWYDDWVLVERERFHEVRLRALETLCESHLASGDVASAIGCASAAVRADPLRETSRRMLIRSLLVEGNRAEALAHHRQFRQVLQPLGLVPSPRFDELAHDLVAH